MYNYYQRKERSRHQSFMIISFSFVLVFIILVVSIAQNIMEKNWFTNQIDYELTEKHIEKLESDISYMKVDIEKKQKILSIMENEIKHKRELLSKIDQWDNTEETIPVFNDN